MEIIFTALLLFHTCDALCKIYIKIMQELERRREELESLLVHDEA